MKFLDIIDFMWNSKDGFLGVFVHSLYAHFFQKHPIVKNAISCVIGMICCVYFTGPMHDLFPSMKIEVIAFLVGLLSMNAVQAVLEIDWKSALSSFIIKK